ncbi:helicase [Priestia megaterium]|jgi:ATP-dependent RNA helicase SUPV3L1/SUV3|uniref:helicase-related protein n=1 Tax=Priestia megaterium TaxID=1404 RepID=UPI002281C834|nr:helicase-related protein [Priestia megaterium]MCY9020144.1 helicase [Priestia megaterium]MCY9025475.1 helicase [Priestia megaterium]
MLELEAIQSRAIEKTKHTLLQDIKSVIGEQDECPDFETYLTDRHSFIKKAWGTTWRKAVVSSVSKKSRKSYLTEKGFEVKGYKPQAIDKLFAKETRKGIEFDSFSWLEEQYGKGNKAEWLSLYGEARAEFAEKEEERKEKERQQSINDRKARYQLQLNLEAAPILEVNKELYYLHIREQLSHQLSKDIKTNSKYIENYAPHTELEDELITNGDLTRHDYETVNDFFQELTGGVSSEIDRYSTIILFETYEDVYEVFITDKIYEIIPTMIMDDLPTSFKEEYKSYTNASVTRMDIIKALRCDLSDLVYEYKKMLVEEKLSDVLEVSDHNLTIEEHQERYQQQLEERRLQQEREREEKKKLIEEEQRQLNYIFSAEYEMDPRKETEYILHLGDTNTGKTYTALKSLKKAASGNYLAPLRLLALEVFEKLNKDGVPCSLKTGEEEKIVEDAQHMAGTVEMFSELEHGDVTVIDEAQMIQDRDRGFSWYKAITRANAKQVHVIGSLSIRSMLEEMLDGVISEIHEYERDIPLKVDLRKFKIEQVKPADALIVFSRKKVLQTAAKLEKDGHKVSVIYGSMPPETRRKQIEQFINRETNVIVSTDAIGMGLNLPIRRIVLLENMKFDGQKRRLLTSQELKQIAGRAGRKGLYNVGEVAFAKDAKQMRELLFSTDEQISKFSIAPTSDMLRRFKEYHHDLGTFFDMWAKFKNPKGTQKSNLAQERELYEEVKDTLIEAKMPIVDLYGYLQLPFSAKESSLKKQWVASMNTIVNREELPEPRMIEGSLEKLELSYKAIGLHLLFLYRMDRRPEAIYWERVREELTDKIHNVLRKDMKKFKRTCSTCAKDLPWNHDHAICDSCFHKRFRRRYGDDDFN